MRIDWSFYESHVLPEDYEHPPFLCTLKSLGFLLDFNYDRWLIRYDVSPAVITPLRNSACKPFLLLSRSSG